MDNFITIAAMPAVNRTKYLSRVNRDKSDKPLRLETTQVVWEDMQVEFADNSTCPEAAVSVQKGISLAILTKRLERLLAFGAEGPGEWQLNHSAKLSDLGGYEHCVATLCDQIVETDPDEQVTIGVMKIKRKSVKHGHASVKLDDAKDLLALIIRHGNAQGLLSLWKSVFWRLDPQFKTFEKKTVHITSEADAKHKVISASVNTNAKATISKITAPCVKVYCSKYDSYRAETINWLSEQGLSVDVGADVIDVSLSYKNFINQEFNYNDNANFYCCVEFKVVPADKPQELWIDNKGKLAISESNWSKFIEKAKALSTWLCLGWSLD